MLLDAEKGYTDTFSTSFLDRSTPTTEGEEGETPKSLEGKVEALAVGEAEQPREKPAAVDLQSATSIPTPTTTTTSQPQPQPQTQTQTQPLDISLIRESSLSSTTDSTFLQDSWEGTLWKQSPSILKRWQSRHVKIDRGHVTYHKDNNTKSGERREVTLKDARIVTSSDPSDSSGGGGDASSPDSEHTLIEISYRKKHERKFLFKCKEGKDCEVVVRLLRLARFEQNKAFVSQCCNNTMQSELMLNNDKKNGKKNKSKNRNNSNQSLEQSMNHEPNPLLLSSCSDDDENDDEVKQKVSERSERAVRKTRNLNEPLLN